MNDIEIKASYGNLDEIGDSQQPDIYITNPIRYKRPEDNFVISKNSNGTVISTYGDDVWDLTPYRLVGHTGTSQINYKKYRNNKVPDAKWTVFVLLFFADTGRATGLSIATLMSYTKFIKVLTDFSSYQGENYFDYFNKHHLIKSLIEHLHTKNLLKGYRALAYHFFSIGEDKVGTKVMIDLIFDLIDNKTKTLPSDKQHPVIPPRIYNELLKQFEVFFDEFQEFEKSFFSFFSKFIKDEQFARSKSQQLKLGFKVKNISPDFISEAMNLGLNDYFKQYKINNIPAYLTFLARLQHACRLVIHLFTGMRSGEVLNLKVGCLFIKKSEAGNIYTIQGETSKLIGQKKAESWVTSPKVCKAIRIAEEIAIKIGSKINLNSKDIPLFITTGYLIQDWKSQTTSTNNVIRLNKASYKHQEFYKLINLNHFTISHDDLEFLDMIDPFRAWSTETNYREGDTWRFTTHQFRRSLAYYVSQSSLVSLPSLRRQLKHITRDMTLYYCQSKDSTSDCNDVSKFISNNKHKADSCAYLQDVIDSDEQLFGAGGKYINKNVKSNPGVNIYTVNRDELEKKFKNGEISYKTTPLGACTTMEPCLKRASLEIAACISCDKAIIKKSKLERVIKIQKSFMNEYEDID